MASSGVIRKHWPKRPTSPPSARHCQRSCNGMMFVQAAAHQPNLHVNHGELVLIPSAWDGGITAVTSAWTA
jgi:hypothetical protein